MEMRPVGSLSWDHLSGCRPLDSPLQNYLLFAMAVSPLILLAVGQVFLPRSKRSIRVWFNPM